MKMHMLQGLRFEIETLFFLSKVKLLQNKYLGIFFFCEFSDKLLFNQRGNM